jgi:hypothetical protein
MLMGNKDFILDLFNRLSKNDIYQGGYSEDKESIRKIFKNTKDNLKSDVLIRLTVIDSMYSTQMDKRYYGLNELAEVISSFSNLKDLAIKFVNNPEDTSCFDYKIGEKKGNLFDEKYGINKQGNKKGLAVSLISKYLCFLTDFKFPIYDSIVLEIFPKLWAYCELGEKECPKHITYSAGSERIKTFVNAINSLIKELKLEKENYKYDVLDRIMWFTGKVCRGNLSLILSYEEYVEFFGSKGKDYKFNIKEEEDLSKLPFLKGKETLNDIFKLAKEIN